MAKKPPCAVSSMIPSRLTLLVCNLAVLVVFASAGISTCDADDPKPTAQSIIEQRRAIMRGEAAGRTKVEVRKSSQADLEKGEISFDDLKFDIEKDEAFDPEKLTETLRFLNGRKVKLSGYILPATLFKETDIDQFVLVRDNLECCFGPGAALFDCVMVEMVPGKTTDFVTRPVTVEGKFVFDPNKYKYPPGVGPNGASHFAIFRIEGVQVR
ncbi:hypothetical protein FHS27_002791 [Rhodopirellula rubra]|uniref:DUF3299 domain-containing protein n=1 Tax=Aporhodopirellula rubra TaxID=980271 RepID=A0A7W5H511_9BACT|nr:DUF3299 domain-containing protein [Aporhodopirellula rubra]MBB3206977.1 hypothetical protein [Aporhodopirellula rubra]